MIDEYKISIILGGFLSILGLGGILRGWLFNIFQIKFEKLKTRKGLEKLLVLNICQERNILVNGGKIERFYPIYLRNNTKYTIRLIYFHLCIKDKTDAFFSVQTTHSQSKIKLDPEDGLDILIPDLDLDKFKAHELDRINYAFQYQLNSKIITEEFCTPIEPLYKALEFHKNLIEKHNAIMNRGK